MALTSLNQIGILNIIWSATESVAFANGYVIALVINVSDMQQSFRRLLTMETDEPGFINQLAPGMGIRQNFAFEYQLAIAVFYLAMIAYLCRKKIRSQFH